MVKFALKGGMPYPFGATKKKEGVNFALFSKRATKVSLLLFEKESPLCEIPISEKTGDVWHIFISDCPPRLAYGYRVEGPIELSHFFNPEKVLLDPYAKSILSRKKWRDDKTPNQPLGLIDLPSFNWEEVKKPNIPLEDLILYEMHVRGFTTHPSSNVRKPGTFLGVIEKIPYLLDLGINAISLMPIYEFNEFEYQKKNPITHATLCNFWGYSPINFFSPMNRYGFGEERDAALTEFKTMVKELHRSGIEVILDVVYNHTAEGNENGPTYSFKGIDCPTYYLLDEQKNFLNYTGCGNTLNCNHPVVQELIRDSLRYWVTEMGVDGFRFDLASILTRGKHGEPLFPSPLIDGCSFDPLLAQTKLIAEPWDATGLYQVGSFYPYESRWAEWNGKYRDTIRRFIKGSPGEKREFATRISGSEDLYGENQSPKCSINYITAHDGFSLKDLVTYNQKHNEANGEENRDGASFNDSWNCGVEGPTQNKKVLALRERQMRNFHLALMISQGIPMILMGNEYGHTRLGNNNPWCQDNELNWFLWDFLEKNNHFYRFWRNLIHLRKKHHIYRRGRFLTDDDIDWHGVKPFNPDWDGDNQFLAFTLIDEIKREDHYIAFNVHDQILTIELPPPPQNKKWFLTVNTANSPPDDFVEEGKREAISSLKYKMAGHSAILLIAKE